MKDAVSVRLNAEAIRALALLEASGLSRSDAIRQALIEAAEARRRSQALREESARAEADEADRDEMIEVARFMESLRGPW